MTPHAPAPQRTRSLAFFVAFVAVAVAVLAAATACQRTAPSPAASSPGSQAANAGANATGADAAGAAASPAGAPTASTDTAAPAVPAAPVKAQVCSLLSAAEVGAIMGKTLIQAQGGGCSYGLDPAAKEKELAQAHDETSNARRAAAGGDLNAMLRGMAQAGSKQPHRAQVMMEQLELSVDASRDGQTEDSLKALYTNTGATVRGAVAPLTPEKRGLTGIIQGVDEVRGLGDWAFATNVASVNMGIMSIRGRLLEARQGPWHVTVSVTIAPDPGIATLDTQLASVARALFAKL
jgi:hypothetical protein